MRQSAFICDLDGTLCETSHREHYLNKTPKDWKGFFSKIKDDPVNVWCLRLIESMRAVGHACIFLTGRDKTLELETVRWLKGHNLFISMCDIHLFMRNEGDYRPDFVVKKEIYLNHIRHNFNIHFAIDDRNSVVDMWRSAGVTCLQCKEGNF